MDANISVERDLEPGKVHPVFEKLYHRSFGFWLNLVKISKLLKLSSIGSLAFCSIAQNEGAAPENSCTGTSPKPIPAVSASSPLGFIGKIGSSTAMTDEKNAG
jgi:hypothetical protein